jgi:hypothetical protein
VPSPSKVSGGGGRLFTLSDVGLEVNALSTLAEEGSLKFPAP